MMKGNTMKHQFVVCLNNDGFAASLECRKIYETVDDPVAREHGHVRVVDESGEDYLYPSELFVAIEVPQAVETALAQAA